MIISLLFILLMSNAVTLRRDTSILFNRIVIKGLILSCILALSSLFVNSLDKGIGLYGGLFHISSFTQSFHIFIILISAIILNLTAFYPRKVYVKEHSSLFDLLLNRFEYNVSKISNKMGEQFRIIEYPLIIVFIITGGIFLISTSDFISLFLSIELQSYGLYILCTLYRDSELATSGGLTYFLLGGLSSCFILLGASLIYASSGTTNLEAFYVISSITEILDLHNGLVFGYNSYYIHLSLLVLSVGFLFKVSAAPFHFWSPDVYDAIPTIVTTFVAIVAKISIFSFLLELVYYTDKPFFHFSWKNSLLLSSLFSLVIGSILGLTQSRIKRLFAYSTISHVGFILLALNINTIESIQAYIFYILQYSISNLNAFIILVSIGFSFYIYVYKDKDYKDNLVDKNNSPIQLISQLKGYYYINPILALSLAITIFSFVGVPPLLGFFAKQMVLSAALDNGYVFMALVAILTSVIGAVYYLNVINQMFFFKHEYDINPSLKNINIQGNIYNLKGESKMIEFKPENIVLNSSLTSIISILTLILTLFIYMPEEIFGSASILTLILFKP